MQGSLVSVLLLRHSRQLGLQSCEPTEYVSMVNISYDVHIPSTRGCFWIQTRSFGRTKAPLPHDRELPSSRHRCNCRQLLHHAACIERSTILESLHGNCYSLYAGRSSIMTVAFAFRILHHDYGAVFATADLGHDSQMELAQLIDWQPSR
jgi:hypothetical protein